jgi:small-conductance mechanosensitive channel
VLANLVAGVMLAVNQPIRIGDLITLDGDTGVVEDIRLTYTFLRTANDARLIVPNERLAGSVLRNDSIVTDTVAVEVKLWIPHEVDEQLALAAIEDAIEGAEAGVGDVTAEGVVLTVSAQQVTVRDRAGREAEVRRQALAALRAAGLR